MHYKRLGKESTPVSVGNTTCIHIIMACKFILCGTFVVVELFVASFILCRDFLSLELFFDFIYSICKPFSIMESLLSMKVTIYSLKCLYGLPMFSKFHVLAFTKSLTMVKMCANRMICRKE